jgi:hypothetical protein
MMIGRRMREKRGTKMVWIITRLHVDMYHHE